MDDDRNDDLVRFGREQMHSEGQRRFFTSLFPSKRLQATRFALQTRLAGLLNAPMFVELLSREHSTWDLRKAMDAGHTIIIDASRSSLGDEVSEIYGRTLVALIQSYALLRGGKKFKTPTYLVIDEAARFVCSDIRTISTSPSKSTTSPWNSASLQLRVKSPF